jgi:hypothetical protein
MTRWPVLDLQWAIPLWLTILCVDALFVSGAAVVLIGAASYMLIVYPTIVKGQSTKGKE